MNKKQIVNIAESNLLELTPNANYSEIYDQLEVQKPLILELSTLLANQVSAKALAGAVSGFIFHQFNGDEAKIREAVYAFINIANKV